jgi:hypothetical protein
MPGVAFPGGRISFSLDIYDRLLWEEVPNFKKPAQLQKIMILNPQTPLFALTGCPSQLLLGTPHVFQLAPHTRARIDAKLGMAERAEGDRQLLYLLRGMMEWCIYPPPVRGDELKALPARALLG